MTSPTKNGNLQKCVVLSLVHAIFAMVFRLHVLSLRDEIEFEVQIAVILRIGPQGELAGDAFALLQHDVFLVAIEIEQRLLPVRVRRVGTGGEAAVLVALAELNGEVAHEGVNVIVAHGVQREVRGERQVFDADGLKVEFFQKVVRGHHLTVVDAVDQRFFDRHFANATHVETVDVVPERRNRGV